MGNEEICLFQVRTASQDTKRLQDVVQTEKKEMTHFDPVYLGVIGMVGFFCAAFIEYVDRKTDKMMYSR